MTPTRVLRPTVALIMGPILLLGLTLAPVWVYYGTESLIWSLVCLALMVMVGLLVWTLVSNQQLAYGPAGVYVVADDENYTLTWNDIERFDRDVVVVRSGGESYGDTGLVILRKTSTPIHVSWINTKASARRLNEALARYTGRATPQLVETSGDFVGGPQPAGEGGKIGLFTGLGLANLLMLRLAGRWPLLWLVMIAVDILVVCVYMGIKMSKDE